MRETENSLQLWFGAVGMLALVELLIRVEKVYVVAADPMTILSRPVVAVSLLISLLTVVVYLFVAIKLRDLIAVHPNVIRVVLVITIIYLALVVALLAVFAGAKGLFWPALELAAAVYLLFNVNRIVKELRE